MKADPSTLRTPKTKGNYAPQHCLTFLEKFDGELRDDWPEMHTFVHEMHVVHLGSGKKVLRDPSDITVIEGADASAVGLATPRRPATRSRIAATASPPARATSTTALSNAQKDTYLHLPAVWHTWNKSLASYVRKAFPDEVRRVLIRLCGDDGLGILEHIEARGRAAKGSALQLSLLLDLDERQRRGVGAPTVSNWEAYAQEIQSIATGAGGIDDDQLLIRLRAGVYAFPESICSRAVDAADAVSTPAEVVSAVSHFLEQEQLRRALTAAYRGDRPPATAPADPTTETEQPWPATDIPRQWDATRHRPCTHQAIKGCDGRHFDFQCPASRSALAVTTDDPSPALAAQRGRDPPMNVSSSGRPQQPSATASWSPFEHPPCLNWRRGREGCDGRHHLPQCPLPRPVAAVDDVTPTPAPALTVIPAPETSAAERDFSALFTTVGPAITTLRPVLSVAGSYCAATDSDYKLAGVQPDGACFDCDGYETASEDGDSCGSYELADETV